MCTLLFLLLTVVGNPKVKAVVAARAEPSVTARQRADISKWIVEYAARWHVDPLLVACVAASESRFLARPRGLLYCRTKIVGERAVEVCRRERRELGMMQSVPRLRVTAAGYWFCFGKVLVKSRLNERRVSTCVGTYELSSRRRWVRRRIGRRGRVRPRCRRHRRYLRGIRRKYPATYKRLYERFWTAATYNWGPRILRHNGSRFDSLGYPIRVMRCYLRFAQAKPAKPVRVVRAARPWLGRRFGLIVGVSAAGAAD